MTGNIKTVYKYKDSFGFINTEKSIKNKNGSRVKFFRWYIPVALCLLTCLILSMFSIRISYLTSDIVQDLKEQVQKVETRLDNSHWLKGMSEFEQAMYDEYATSGTTNENNSLEMGSDSIANATELNSLITETSRADVIGEIKYSKTEVSTTPDSESVLAKVLKKEYGKGRPKRSTKTITDMESDSNEETGLNIEQAFISSKKLDNTIATPAAAPRHDMDFPDSSKRYVNQNKHFKAPLMTHKLQKLPPHLRESVEEFSVEPEVTTVKSTHPSGSSRRNKNRLRHNIETLEERGNSGKKNILPAIHYDGDSSGYVVGKHTNYNGNGHLSHPSQIYSDWTVANWVKSTEMDEHFSMDKGLLKVKDTGLYLVYAQIYYLDDHDTNGYRIYQNEEPICQCTTMTHSTEKIFKGNTCFTSRLALLQENDVISIRDLGNSRYTIFEGGKSFFGLVKLK